MHLIYTPKIIFMYVLPALFHYIRYSNIIHLLTLNLVSEVITGCTYESREIEASTCVVFYLSVFACVGLCLFVGLKGLIQGVLIVSSV